MAINAELFTNDYTIFELSRGPATDCPGTNGLYKADLELLIVPPPPEDRLAAAIGAASVSVWDRPVFVREVESAADSGTILRADVFERTGESGRGPAMLNDYASSFGDKLAVVLNTKPGAVLDVMQRVMTGEIISDSPFAQNLHKR